MGLQNLMEGFRRWLDGDDAPAEVSQPKPRSKWEDFMVAIAREVEAVMQREMFTPPGGPTYIPREYIIFLSSDDDSDWQGEKREGLERGLHFVLGRRAAELAGTAEFQTKSFALEMRVDTTLERGQYRVQPVWDKQSDRTMVTPRRPPSRPSPPPMVQTPVMPPVMPDDEDDDSTVVRPRGRTGVQAAPLFLLVVERTGAPAPSQAETRPFSTPRVTIGRGSKQMSVDLKLEGDLEVSRHHATIELQNGQFAVTCEGRNSIFVDSTEVLSGETAAVRPGQRIIICSYVLAPQLPVPAAEPAAGSAE